VCYDADYTPFGQELAYVNNCPQNYKFTGIERDIETGNDHTWYRGYEQNLGRWMSPDPMAGDITNPQSLNRYAYVLNNPTTLTDPLGLCMSQDEGCGTPPRHQHQVICDGFGCGGAAIIVDGVEWYGDAAVALGEGIIESQGGVQCPGNDCDGLRATQGPGNSTVWQQWVPGYSKATTSDICDGCFLAQYVAYPGHWQRIVFTQTSPTTWTFVSSYPFYETVGRFVQAGFHAAPLDLLNRLHPGQLDLRDNSLVCSAHVAINKNSGGAPGVPTTGDIHLDTVNPYPTWSGALGPGGFALTALAHGVLDVFGGGLYPGSQACR
jgi:RHS repeat-associated protein